MAELDYNIKLPNIEYWFLQRVDIAICYDLENQENVKKYINSLSRCQYPRRNAKFYYDESLYLSGSITTLKIYNKLVEFKKHDLKKFKNSDFNLIDYFKTIQGFIRFECEIKKRKLLKIYNKEKHIRVISVNYEYLKEVWSDEFMKLLKYIENDLEIVRGREEVYSRLQELYKSSRANQLFNFYCSIQLNGLIDIKERTSSSTYYRNLKELEKSNIDISQCYKITYEDTLVNFNPFTAKEVA